MSTRLTEKDVQGTLSLVSELIGKELRLRCVNRTVTPQRYQIFTADNRPWPQDLLAKSLKETELYLRGVLAGIYAQQDADKQAKLVQLWASVTMEEMEVLANINPAIVTITTMRTIKTLAKYGHSEKLYNAVKQLYYDLPELRGSLPPVNLPQSIIEKWEESLRLIGKR